MAPIHLLTFLICVRGWGDVFLDTLLTLVQQKRKSIVISSISQFPYSLFGKTFPPLRRGLYHF